MNKGVAIGLAASLLAIAGFFVWQRDIVSGPTPDVTLKSPSETVVRMRNSIEFDLPKGWSLVTSNTGSQEIHVGTSTVAFIRCLNYGMGSIQDAVSATTSLRAFGNANKHYAAQWQWAATADHREFILIDTVSMDPHTNYSEAMGDLQHLICRISSIDDARK